MKKECSVRYTTDELALWEQDGDSQVHRRLRSPDFFRRLAGLFQKGFTHAGLSSDCRMVFFHNATKLHVYPVISRSTDIPAEGWPLVWNLGRHNPLADVSLSDRVVAISTQKAVELHLIGSSSANSQGPRIISHDNWDPSGLAIYENGLEVLVAVGYQRETKTSRQGRVFIYSSKFCWGGLEKETIAQSYDLPREDFPKHLNFDDQGKRLTCITAIGNSVLIWHLGSPNPFEITRNHHRPVR